MPIANRILNFVKDEKGESKRRGYKGVVLALSAFMRSEVVKDLKHEDLEVFFDCKLYIDHPVLKKITTGYHVLYV
jgi:hypothetical protein